MSRPRISASGSLVSGNAVPRVILTSSAVRSPSIRECSFFIHATMAWSIWSPAVRMDSVVTRPPSEIRLAIEEPLHDIVDAVRTTLDQTPPELAGDIMDRGLVLTGGGALLRGLDERLRHETGMPVHIAEDPLHSVAMGAGKCVEEFEALQQVLVSEPRRRRPWR